MVGLADGLAYAELFFVDALWPDFDAKDLYEAIASYQTRERRFGLTQAQLTAGEAMKVREP